MGKWTCHVWVCKMKFCGCSDSDNELMWIYSLVHVMAYKIKNINLLQTTNLYLQYLFLFYVFCVHFCCSCVLAMPVETKRGWWILSNCNYRQLLAVVWVLRTEPGSSARATNVLNLWAISPAPDKFFFKLHVYGLIEFHFYTRINKNNNKKSMPTALLEQNQCED